MKRLAVGLVAASTLSCSAQAASITWNGGSSAVWATGTNWSANLAPGSGDVAVFNNAGNANTTLDLGSGITVGGLLFDTSSAAAYTIGYGGVNNQTLTLANGGSITVNSGVAVSETIKAKVVLGTDGSTQSYSILNNAAATSSTLTISGSIVGSTGTGVKTLAVSGGGYTVLSGTVSDGTSGTVGIVKTGTGTLILSGSSTFTGSILLNGGKVILRGDTGSLASTVSIVGNGGTFGYDGSGAGTGTKSQTLGSLTMATGETTIYVARAATSGYTLTFSSYSRAAGAVGIFQGSSTSNTFGSGNVATTIATNGYYKITGQSAGFIDQGTFVGGTSYAWYDSTNGVRGINYGTDAGSLTTAGTTSVTGTYVQVTGAVTNQQTTTMSTLNIASNNTFTINSSATLTVNGILKSNSTAGTAIIGGGSIKAATNAELVLRTAQSGDLLALNSSILANGTNMVTISGPGKIQLGGSNSFTGGVSIVSGFLRIGNASALNSVAPNSVTFTGESNSGIMQLSGFSVTVAGLNAASSDAAVENISSTTASTLTISNTGTSTYAGALRDGTSSASLSLVKAGAGTQILSGSNTYTGTTLISGGELDVNGSLAASSAVTVASGAVLGGYGVISGAVSGTSATIKGAGLTLGATTLYGNSLMSGTTTASSLTVAGGTTSITGKATSSGTIGVASGATLKNTGNTISTGTLSVASGGTLNNNGAITAAVGISGVLSGTGTITGNVFILNGGTLTPGNSAGTTTVNGNLSVADGAKVSLEFNSLSSFDKIVVNGGVSLSSSLTLTLSDTFLSECAALTSGTTLVLLENDGTDAVTGVYSSISYVTTSGTFAVSGTAFTVGSTIYDISYTGGDGNDVTLTVVPEPSTWAMLAGGVGLLASFQRCRRRM
ncbi:MAG: autotransporter-associated beta strand repeat-containing protein [Chthoniobacteraceae bacterium]